MPIKTSESPNSSRPASTVGNVLSLGTIRQTAGSDGKSPTLIYELSVSDYPRAEVDPRKGRSVDKYVAECESKGRGPALAAARQRLAQRALADGGKPSLKELRLARGLSQAELAKLMESSQPLIARLEAGHDEPRVSTLRKLSSVLEVDYNTLMEAL
ncbi:MAG: helix-turn-helix transcriptional regulator [Rhodospirillaceae bacterium]